MYSEKKEGLYKESYDNAVQEFMRACKRLAYESNERMMAMEKELDNVKGQLAMIQAIDTSILEALSDDPSRTTRS